MPVPYKHHMVFQYRYTTHVINLRNNERPPNAQPCDYDNKKPWLRTSTSTLTNSTHVWGDIINAADRKSSGVCRLEKRNGNPKTFAQKYLPYSLGTTDGTEEKTKENMYYINRSDDRDPPWEPKVPSNEEILKKAEQNRTRKYSHQAAVALYAQLIEVGLPKSIAVYHADRPFVLLAGHLYPTPFLKRLRERENEAMEESETSEDSPPSTPRSSDNTGRGSPMDLSGGTSDEEDESLTDEEDVFASMFQRSPATVHDVSLSSGDSGVA